MLACTRDLAQLDIIDDWTDCQMQYYRIDWKLIM
jgi:hypothetical protein